MPDFLCIGLQKAGTTWFYENIRRHPDAWLPFIKEVHFWSKRFLDGSSLKRKKSHDLEFQFNFSEKARQRIRKLRKGKVPSCFGKAEEIAYLERLLDRSFFMTDEWYDFLFSPAPEGKKRGEVTPAYCAIREEGILHLKKRYVNVKLIYFLRDPVARALSSMRMIGERRGFDLNNPVLLWKLAKDCLVSRHFFKLGDCRSHIPLWDRHFGDQVCYIPFGKIRSDPEGLFRDIEDFIGLCRFDGYPYLHEKIYATKKSVTIPEKIRTQFLKAYAEQYEFLKTRFAPEFLDQLGPGDASSSAAARASTKGCGTSGAIGSRAPEAANQRAFVDQRVIGSKQQ